MRFVQVGDGDYINFDDVTRVYAEKHEGVNFKTEKIYVELGDKVFELLDFFDLYDLSDHISYEYVDQIVQQVIEFIINVVSHPITTIDIEEHLEKMY